MKPVSVLLAALALSIFALGCASADNSWRGEFDARLEGSAAVVEEALERVHPDMSPEEYFALGTSFAPSLFFKSELIAELDPPKGCEAVQVKGKAAAFGASEALSGAFKNLTPSLERHFPDILRSELATFEKREREAETCA